MAITGFAREESRPHYGSQRIVLDPSQRAVIEVADAASAAVIGAPGSGKTATIIELVADRVLSRGWSADELVVLTSSRASATRLRDALALRLGVATNGPLARTVNSLAFEVVGHAARAAGAPVPRLVTGGEQDVDILDLLEGSTVEWPDPLSPEVRSLRAFRTELRELMGRATEYGVTPEQMRHLGRVYDHPEWVASADFIDEYRQVVTASRPDQLDSSEFGQFAAAAIADGHPGERVERLRLVVVDDFQEATESTLAILRALAARGTSIIAVGDPDVATNAFRGGEPDALGRLATVLGVPVETHFLSTVHRHGALLRGFVSGVTGRYGTAAAGKQREAAALVEGGSVATLEAQTPAREWAAIARQLREAHLMHGVPWSQMSVIVRSSDQIGGIRRALALAEVPARSSVGGAPLRDDRAARALLSVVEVGVGRADLTPPIAAALLLGPFGGLEKLSLRRLRLALRAEEISGGGSRSSDDLLVDALAAPGRFVTIDHRVGRAAERVATMLHGIRERFAAGGTIEELLWFAWDASGLAKSWYEQALGTGISAAEANANLDGVLALFTAARRYVERRPGDAPLLFLASVLDAEVPEDTLSPQPTEHSVLVTTPQGTVGLEFELVVVAALQEGAWPNLRLRGSLLGPQELVRVVTGVDSSILDERKLVLADELRMFALAVSRARRRVILAAVANDDEAPSVLMSLVPPGSPALDSRVSPLSLRGLTGRLRRELASGDVAAASALARLSGEEVPGANPAQWHGLLPLSTEEPLYADDEQVPISPSRLARFEESPLDWFIETVSGSQSTTAMGMGTILHWAMETTATPELEQLWAAVESRWSELLFEAPWMGEAQKAAARVLAAGIAEYLADFDRDGKSLVGAESRFRLEVENAVVNGSIDRVERGPNGEVVIVDLKTGNPNVRADFIGEHPQLAAYQLAYASGVLDDVLEEGHSPGGAKLLFVKKGDRTKAYKEGHQAPFTEEQFATFRTRIRLAALGMAAAEFEGALELTGWNPGGTSELAIHRVRAVSSD